jgi:two-component system chemotaxis response regulator CheB
MNRNTHLAVTPSTVSTRGIAGVVIGASAGGVDALSVLLPFLPAEFCVPVVVVIHLRPEVPSLLPELFATRCALPVCEAEDKMPLEAGHLYLAPPDYHLMVERDGADLCFALSIDPPVRFSRPSIDVLFESAAFVWRERALGVLLSGANDDGTRGLAAIRAAGGASWVQAPETALAETMPAHAITHGVADSVLTLDEIGHALRRCIQ